MANQLKKELLNEIRLLFNADYLNTQEISITEMYGKVTDFIEKKEGDIYWRGFTSSNLKDDLGEDLTLDNAKNYILNHLDEFLNWDFEIEISDIPTIIDVYASFEIKNKEVLRQIIEDVFLDFKNILIKKNLIYNIKDDYLVKNFIHIQKEFPDPEYFISDFMTNFIVYKTNATNVLTLKTLSFEIIN